MEWRCVSGVSSSVCRIRHTAGYFWDFGAGGEIQHLMWDHTFQCILGEARTCCSKQMQMLQCFPPSSARPHPLHLPGKYWHDRPDLTLQLWNDSSRTEEAAGKHQHQVYQVSGLRPALWTRVHSGLPESWDPPPWSLIPTADLGPAWSLAVPTSNASSI